MIEAGSIMQASSVIFSVQNEWLNNVKSIAGQSTKRALHIFSQLMFIELGQFILEFLQNAEDARMELGKKGGFFRIELYNDKIVIEHNGKPFDENDLRNLCSIHTSKKPSKGYKGYIGIGWKSVFKVSSHVEVYSGQYSFMFSKRYWKERRDLTEKYGVKPEDVPWQVIPIPIQPTEYIPSEITRFVIYLEDPSSYEEIAKTVDNLKPHVFMFLDYISRIEVRDNVRGITRSVEWFTHDSEEKEGVRIQKITLLYKENRNKYYKQFLVFKKAFKVPNDVREDRDTIAAERGDVVEREVAIAFALEDDIIKSIDEGQFWGVYSFLPLHEVRSGLRFLIQADFIVHPGRRSINYEAKWNYWLMECVADLVKFAVKYLAERYRKNYLEVFDYTDISDPFYYNLVKPTVIKLIEEELNDPEVVCIKGHVVKLSKTVMYDDMVAELIKLGIIGEEDLKYIYGEEKHFLDPGVKLRRRDGARVKKMGFTELLNKEYIEFKKKQNLTQALDMLAKIYELGFRKGKYIPELKRFIITRSGEVKLASEVYYSEIPEEVRDLMNKYSEIKEYVEKLDFIHEELVKRLDKEVLEWIGIKRISFNEIVKKILLPRIYADSPPPSKEELLSITSIVKRARISVDKPVWVITVNGEIKRSNEVYYPYQWFKPLELFIKAGIDFLDINAYLKYDSDENGWMKLFESAGIRGAQQCHYGNTHPDYVEIIGKLIDLVNSLTDKNENIKYIRVLKQLYQTIPCWLEAKKLKVKILTDDGEFTYSTECLLHHDYKPKENWSIWRDRGFNKIGPFVSPEYIDRADSENIYSWRKFFVEALGVKEEAKEYVEEFALWFTRRKLEESGYRVEKAGDGYDLRVIGSNNETYYVEVKGRRKLDDIELTEKETEKAREYREKYWLIVVYDIPNNPRIKRIIDPIRLLTKIKIGKEQIEKSEEL